MLCFISMPGLTLSFLQTQSFIYYTLVDRLVHLVYSRWKQAEVEQGRASKYFILSIYIHYETSKVGKSRKSLTNPGVEGCNGFCFIIYSVLFRRNPP
jgi:hypothetical protein